ncbi:carbohydrate sulfotransferase 15-like [Mercenaria mercenaria]|uniref:carbohydrate sulfotransferase 15-like n=1 Tax=Mercenaria mercenaria TaxID=6596 RepID=UPI00234E8775|nr:carbohydrate sulfotransferase 15-like [Mercenaria mercenaria]
MDLMKRKLFLALVGAYGVIFILLHNLVEFGSTREVIVLAANFHNSSLSFLTSLNLNLSVLAKDNHGLQHAITEDKFKDSLNKLLRNLHINVTNEVLRYKNMHNKSNIHKNYQQTQKTSKPESSEKQAVRVDTDYGKDLVREEGFTVDSSCIRRVTGVEDILCMNRPQFLPGFRNPCWYQRGSLRCLPYFHIIGVCKTGTTDLFERLSHHPQILKNNGIFGKETQYWTWRRYGHRHFYMEITDRKTLDNFIDQFDAGAIERYTKRMPNGSLYHPVVTGHGDPMDFWDQSSWKQIPQNDPTTGTPEVTTPTLIKHVNPNAKLILIFRDPIERLFSSYLHGGFGTTAAEFHKDVLMSQSLLTSCARDRSMKACL